MRKITYLAAIICIVSATVAASVLRAAEEDTGRYLAKYAKEPEPWLEMGANSEQTFPIYLGSTPREIVLRLIPADNREPAIYEALRGRGEAEARRIHDSLVDSGALAKEEPLELEMWPTTDSGGQLTWAFGRWRKGAAKPWERLSASMLAGAGNDPSKVQPILPVTLDPKKEDDFTRIFGDALSMKGLYEKRAFGNCVWTDADGKISEAWLTVDKADAYGREMRKEIRDVGLAPSCRVIPQPPRLNGKPATFLVRVAGYDVAWPKSIKWKKEVSSLPGVAKARVLVKDWPADFADLYKADLLTIAGEAEASFPASGRKETFSRKNCAEPASQLGDLVTYLEERYGQMGLKTWRQEFKWRGEPAVNLIATIPGRDASLKPVVIACHIDTAFEPAAFEKSKGLKRISSPGADDDSSGVAALLASARALSRMVPERQIVLANLTGSEFPADSLGARRYIGELLREKKDVGAVIVVDAIGRPGTGAPKVRVSPGESRGSLRAAKAVCDAARSMGGPDPSLKFRFDPRSRVYPTDAYAFDTAGFPVVVVSEERPELGGSRHASAVPSEDTSKGIDWGYAATIAKIVIEAAAELADEKVAREADARVTQPDWSVMEYTGADEPDSSTIYGRRIKGIFDAAAPDNVEIITQRDVEWPDGTVRAWQTNGLYAEQELGEDDSASRAAFVEFLKWAKALSAGRRKLLILQGRSSGWRGMIQDYNVPGRKGQAAPMALGEIASALKEAELRPDVLVLDADFMGNAEAIEELRDAAPYLVVSQSAVPRGGLPAARLYEILKKPEVGARDLARALPEAYVAEYSRSGRMAKEEPRYRTVTVTSVDTSRWNAFADKFKRLVQALKGAGIASLTSAQPGWAKSFVSAEGNADIVEFLNRLALLTGDVAVRAGAAELIDDIGYPDAVAADNAATVTLEGPKVRSFELRIDACVNSTRDKTLEDTIADWKRANQDLSLPDSLIYDCIDIHEKGGRAREFVVRCPEGALKKTVTLRPWLPGARYANLTVVDHAGNAATRKLFRDRDYFSVKEFPPSSFIVSEAHSQGGVFIHGIGVSLDPASGTDPSYAATAWNARTGWAEILSAMQAPKAPEPKAADTSSAAQPAAQPAASGASGKPDKGG